MPAVQILLATYNGAPFLTQQLDSLFSQTLQDFEILAADDGSSDATLALLRARATAHPQQLRIVATDRVGGAARNFLRLVAAADAPYMMFADQDDVWLPRKIEQLLGRIRAHEVRQPSMPLLVFSDLAVVDADLQTICGSFAHYQGTDPTRTDLSHLLLRNAVPGCATIFNGQLARLIANDSPDTMYMHDWWLALVASIYGEIVYEPAALTLYRQHASNSIGAHKRGGIGIGHFTRRTLDVLRGGEFNRPIRRIFNQADALLKTHGGALDAEEFAEVERIASLCTRGPFSRRYIMLRHGLLRDGLVRNIATLISA